MAESVFMVFNTEPDRIKAINSVNTLTKSGAVAVKLKATCSVWEYNEVEFNDSIIAAQEQGGFYFIHGGIVRFALVTRCWNGFNSQDVQISYEHFTHEVNKLLTLSRWSSIISKLTLTVFTVESEMGLKITRTEKERFVIDLGNELIVVEVLKAYRTATKGKVTFMIDAPDTIPIHRAELFVQREGGRERLEEFDRKSSKKRLQHRIAEELITSLHSLPATDDVEHLLEWVDNYSDDDDFDRMVNAVQKYCSKMNLTLNTGVG